MNVSSTSISTSTAPAENETPTVATEVPLPDANVPTLDAAVVVAPAIAELSPAACASRLADLFPALFAGSTPLPLKLRIQVDIQQRAPGTFTKKSLSVFLHRHTTNTAYLRAVANAPQRIDLDGQPAGDIADEHRQAAVAELERRRALHEARRVAERDAQRSANEEARRVRAAEVEQRREATAMLRAFESTTLTLANFCALKGLTEAELEALLTQARQAPEPPRTEPHPAEQRGPRAPHQQRPNGPQRPHPNRRPAR